MVTIPTVVHCKRDKYTVLIDRSTKWGNPFPMGFDGINARRRCIQQHKDWILKQPHLMQALPELAGQTLGCWCKPEPCHGDTLAKLVAEYLVDKDNLLHFSITLDQPSDHYQIILYCEDHGYFRHPKTTSDYQLITRLKDHMESHNLARRPFNLFFWERL